MRRMSLLSLAGLLVLSLLVPFTGQARSVDFAVYSSPERLPLYEEFFAAFTEKNRHRSELHPVPRNQIKSGSKSSRALPAASPDIK